MLDCTRARLTPSTREEIHESRRILPLETETVSSSLRPALLTLVVVVSCVELEVAVTNLETLGKKEMKEEEEGERRYFTEVNEKLGTGEMESIVVDFEDFPICYLFF